MSIKNRWLVIIAIIVATIVVVYGITRPISNEDKQKVNELLYGGQSGDTAIDEINPIDLVEFPELPEPEFEFAEDLQPRPLDLPEVVADSNIFLYTEAGLQFDWLINETNYLAGLIYHADSSELDNLYKQYGAAWDSATAYTVSLDPALAASLLEAYYMKSGCMCIANQLFLRMDTSTAFPILDRTSAEFKHEYCIYMKNYLSYYDI